MPDRSFAFVDGPPEPAIPEGEFDPQAIRRPAPALLTYYILLSALSTVGFPIFFVPLFLKYITLRYRFDEQGISMSWGVLFQKEIFLTYRRIQDIHVTRNLFHRWLGLAAVAIQTASGTTGAEMVIEGIHEPEKLRDFLYARMRGARGDLPRTRALHTSPSRAALPGMASGEEALAILREIRDEVRRLASRGEAAP